EAVAARIEIHAPGIARTLGEDVECALAFADQGERTRIVAPDGGVELDTADVGLREYTVQAVELAVRAPLKGVERLVGVVAAEALEENLLLIALPAAVGVLEKEEIGRRAEKHAA